MSIKIDKNLCVGCGACAGVCPSSFTMADDGKAEAMGESDCAMNAIESCPVQAISAD